MLDSSEEPLLVFVFPAAGQHLHRRLRRRLPGDSAGPDLRLRLHLLRDHPQRFAHLHPLQQVLRLLLQAQVQPVHGLAEETREGPLCQEDHQQARPLLRKPPLMFTEEN